MGTLNDKHLFAAEVEAIEAPVGWSWMHLRFLHMVLPDALYAMAGRALQLIHWDRSHKHCGRCGHLTFIRTNERCRECSSCGQLAYPKMAPAVLALIKRDDKILLARSPHFPEKFYSVLAGFVDPGETLEQCVSREVLEEVGLKVKNIRYFGSQPWPLSHSLMIAFTCDWEAGEIQIDPAEIEHAAWFDRSHLPQLAPPISLARMLIDSYVFPS
jgi:NAD+ diphosphatase